jgi:hypothetical protein
MHQGATNGPKKMRKIMLTTALTLAMIGGANAASDNTVCNEALLGKPTYAAIVRCNEDGINTTATVVAELASLPPMSEDFAKIGEQLWPKDAERIYDVRALAFGYVRGVFNRCFTKDTEANLDKDEAYFREGKQYASSRKELLSYVSGYNTAYRRGNDCVGMFAVLKRAAAAALR